MPLPCKLIIATIILAMIVSPAVAQRPRREVKWVNSDIPSMPGLEHRVLDSQALGHEVGFVLWTPPSIQDSDEKRFAVVYFLHGAGGSEKSDSAGFSSRIQQAMQDDHFPPAICVFPNGGMSGYREDVEAMIVDELIPLIDSSFPTRAEASGRVICGFSMGGAGAVHLALRHPHLFCAAGSWGGALSFRGSGDDSPLIKTAEENAQTLKEQGFALLTVNGDRDRPDGFKPLQQVLERHGIAHRMIELKDTEHNLGRYYELASDDMLSFLAEQLTQPRSDN